MFGKVNFHVSTTETWNDTNGNGIQDAGEYYYCARRLGIGIEGQAGYIRPGVICYAESRGNIDGRLTAHELGHVFNATMENRLAISPYDTLADEGAGLQRKITIV